MLKRGKANKKLGDKVSVKKWKDMTIYSLTLEERATCPTHCEQWENCYGNNMPFGHRFDHTHPEFLLRLGEEVKALNEKHPNGFVIRLHVLGDFYDAHYVAWWHNALRKYKGLRVFGYTHHRLLSTIGQMINDINRIYPDRWRVRFSDDLSTPLHSRVIASDKPIIMTTIRRDPDGDVICPEQSDLTDSCATCGFCWSSDQPVVFIEH